VRRSRFVAALVAAGTLRAVPARAQAHIDFHPGPADLKRIEDAIARHGVSKQWHAPGAMPPESPLAFAYPQGPGAGGPFVWLNLDHRELATPRSSHEMDEAPVIAAAIQGLIDLDMLNGGEWDLVARQLKAILPAQRSAALQPLARGLVHDYHITLAPPVTDAEFAADAFPFDVVRLLTIGQEERAIVVDSPPAGTSMPPGAPIVAYVGRTDRRHPGMRVVWTRRDASKRVTGFREAYTIAFALAAAETQPEGSSVRRQYEEARAFDEQAKPSSYMARIAFANPFIARVLSLAFIQPSAPSAPATR
jgi:hypothetical protein